MKFKKETHPPISIPNYSIYQKDITCSMTLNNFTAKERYTLLEIDRLAGENADFQVDLKQRSPQANLVYKLLHLKYVEGEQVLSDGPNQYTLLSFTTTGEWIRRENEEWIKTVGRRGRIELLLFAQLETSQRWNPNNILSMQIDEKPITEKELQEALTSLTGAGAITTHGSLQSRFPIRIDLSEDWLARMHREEPPAWESVTQGANINNSYDHSQNTTYNNSLNNNAGNISTGDHANQTQTNNNGLTAESLAEITAYFQEITQQIQDDIKDPSTQQLLLEETKNAEESVKDAKTKGEINAILSKFVSKFAESGANTASSTIATMLISGFGMVQGLPLPA